MEGTLLKVFTTKAEFGNPVAVVDGRDVLLSAEQMQAQATQINLIMTVFLLPPTQKDFDVRFRFFSVKTEMGFCGHGILGAAHVYMKQMDKSEFRVETNSSVVHIVRQPSGVIQFETSGVTMLDVPLDRNEIAQLLGGDETMFDERAPFCVASIGSPKLLVPIRNLEVLHSLQPNLEEMADWSALHRVNGVYAYTFDTLDPKATAHARSFNPLYGVNEDPATGVAAGALGGVLIKHQFCSPFLIEQGDIIGSNSRIIVHVGDDDIRIGGPVIEIGPISIHE